MDPSDGAVQQYGWPRSYDFKEKEMADFRKMLFGCVDF